MVEIPEPDHNQKSNQMFSGSGLICPLKFMEIRSLDVIKKHAYRQPEIFTFPPRMILPVRGTTRWPCFRGRVIINLTICLLFLFAYRVQYLTAEVSLAVLSDSMLMAPSSSPSKPCRHKRRQTEQ